MPFDLPGAVDKDERTRLSKYQFENTLADRTSSTLTLEDVDVGISISPHQLGELRHAVDVAIQCTPGHSSVTHYSPLSSPRPHVKAEHSKRIYSVNSLSVIPRSDRSQSVPSTPDKQRRATGGRAFFPVGGQSPTLDHSLGSDQRSTNRQSNSSRLSGEHQIVDVSYRDNLFAFLYYSGGLTLCRRSCCIESSLWKVFQLNQMRCTVSY